MTVSTLQKYRTQYKPHLPRSLRKGIGRVAIETGDPTDSISHQQETKHKVTN